MSMDGSPRLVSIVCYTLFFLVAIKAVSRAWTKGAPPHSISSRESPNLSPPLKKVPTPSFSNARFTALNAHPFASLYSFNPYEPHAGNNDLLGNITSHLEHKFGGEPLTCFNTPASIFLVEWPEGEPQMKGTRCLHLGVEQTIRVRALNSSRHPLCSGGDFIEGLLASSALRTRLRFVDNGDGVYMFSFHLPDDPLLVGSATLSLFHLWSSLGGIFHEGWFQLNALQKNIHDEVVELKRYGECPGMGPSASLPILKPPTASCREVDFMAVPFWEGYWVAENKDALQCTPGACSGRPRGVLSSSWVYRLPLCIFHLFSQKDSRTCLNGSWVFSSGDSNGPDTVSNLAQHTLGLNMGSYIDRHHPTLDWKGGDVQLWGEENKTQPEEWPSLHDDSNQTFFFHASNVWNSGIHECCGEASIFWGISVTKNTDWKEKNLRYISSMGKDLGPDVLFINSGLHDGMHYLRYKGGLGHFLKDLDESAVPWWYEMSDAAAGGNLSACRPRLIWRHSVASAGPHRTHRANPQSMALFNRFTAESLLSRMDPKGSNAPPASQFSGICRRPLNTDSRSWRFLDMYDLTFPFHFDLSVSDGGHYGRHHCEECDSVDRMQIQVLLNGLCDINKKSRQSII